VFRPRAAGTAAIERLISDQERLNPGQLRWTTPNPIQPAGLLSGAQGGDGLDQAIAFELAEHVLNVLWWLGSRISDLLSARGDGSPVDADLIEHEVIG
jgi:hypothetical protein